jgi:hypothetical protein
MAKGHAEHRLALRRDLRFRLPQDRLNEVIEVLEYLAKRLPPGIETALRIMPRGWVMPQDVVGSSGSPLSACASGDW